MSSVDAKTSAQDNAAGRSLCDYTYWHDDVVRFNDIDPLWHLTSTAYLIMMENARIRFVRAAGEAIDTPPFGWMVVNATVNYLSQVRYPDAVRIGTRVERVGRSSVKILQAMFNGDVCAATVEATLVLIDENRDRSVTVPDDLRSSLLELSASGRVDA